jgi:hypothetical protein
MPHLKEPASTSHLPVAELQRQILRTSTILIVAAIIIMYYQIPPRWPALMSSLLLLPKLCRTLSATSDFHLAGFYPFFKHLALLLVPQLLHLVPVIPSS